MAKPKVLFVLTSHDKMGTTDKKTGWYLPEMAHPYAEVSPHAEIVVASPKGGEAPLDPSSVEMFKSDAASQDFLANNAATWKTTTKLSDFSGKAKDFAAIFYVGGHGPMFDLATDKTSIALIEEFVAAGKPVSAVCHGPAVFVNAKSSDGTPLLHGVEATGFTNAEEDSVGLSQYMPFMLETEMVGKGSKFAKADEPWGECVKVGKTKAGTPLITGQNPVSAGGVGKEILKAIRH
ncbi:MAG: hypothetical protein Q9160_000299 [Pyrenula sp. 1 TL-2023]